MINWISVEDRLPKEGKFYDVVICPQDGFQTRMINVLFVDANFHDLEKRYFDGDSIASVLGDVTHYAKINLPEVQE